LKDKGQGNKGKRAGKKDMNNDSFRIFTAMNN